MAKINRTKKRLDVTIEDSVVRYLDYCEHRKLATETIKTYTSHLTKFYMGMPTMNISDLTQEQVIEFLNQFEQEHNYSNRSMNNYMRYLNTFFTWCLKEKLIEKEIKLSYRKLTKKLQSVPTEHEVAKLLKVPDIETCTWNEYSCFVICALIVSTGLRINSICGIKKEDVNLDKGYINILVTKNKIEQRVYINKKMAKIIREYLEVIDSASEYLFCNSKTDEQLHPHVASTNVIRYARSRGVNASCHSLRRYFSCEFLKQSGNITALSKILFHSDISITMKYVESLNIDDFKQDLKSYNPINKFL